MPSPAKSKGGNGFASLQKLREVGPVPENAGTTQKMGRPLTPGAKSRDPEYRAWTGYVRIETMNDAEDLLNRDRGTSKTGKKYMSDLIEELLAGWVATRKSDAAGKGETSSKK
jgi:hypothetical protein